MKKVKTQIENVPKDKRELTMLPLFGPETRQDGAVNMGCAVFGPGVRVPKEGHTSHDTDEFSYIISGNIKCFSGGKTHELKAGDAAYIPAGEPHYSCNESNEVCTLVYMLVKNN
jgi:quercetin dioxygenase-like cupin family protein